MCALYGGSRDISLFRGLNRELMGDIISQQCSIYKYKLEETRVNIYGESPGIRYLKDPVLLNCLISRGDQTNSHSDLGVDSDWSIEFRFLRDDLIDANLILDIGDIILFQELYFEVDSTNENQYVTGKNPAYPNAPNPLETDLDQFGSNWSVIAKTHAIPSDKLGISPNKERF
jgi:hypothetical protein